MHNSKYLFLRFQVIVVNVMINHYKSNFKTVKDKGKHQIITFSIFPDITTINILKGYFLKWT